MAVIPINELEDNVSYFFTKQDIIQYVKKMDGFKGYKGVMGEMGERYVNNFDLSQHPHHYYIDEEVQISYEVKTESIDSGRVTLEVYNPIDNSKSGVAITEASYFYFCKWDNTKRCVTNHFKVLTSDMLETLQYIIDNMLGYDDAINYQEMATAHNYYIPPYYFNMTKKQLEKHAKLIKFYYDNNNIQR
jgi:hypothetical protein